MCMFLDSPIEYCPVAKRYVLVDQTQECCAREMGCPPVGCPLARFFAAPLRTRETEPDESSTSREDQAGGNGTPAP